MTDAQISWPSKTREHQWAAWDSTRLNDFRFRNSDIVIATWGKCGTTLMQQIVAQLVFQGAPDVYGQKLSPWIEFRLVTKEEAYAMAEAQTHRRFIKTHLAIDAIPFLTEVKYIYIGRDLRDVAWSLYNHHANTRPSAFELFNSAPGLTGPLLEPPNCDIKTYYHHFLDHGHPPGFPHVSFWTHVQGWWNARQLPNVLLVHFSNLKADLSAQARRIAEFLDIDVDEERWPTILAHCDIAYMRAQASQYEPLKILFDAGAETFIYKGTNARWKDVLSAHEIARADEVAARNLTPECAHWLKTGELPE